jgi:hypothetical protein
VKRIVETKDGGLEGLLGEKVTLLCVNYFYTGTLSGVNERFVELSEPSIVYETGEWSSKDWQDAQALPCDSVNVMLHAIEAFGVLK